MLMRQTIAAVVISCLGLSAPVWANDDVPPAPVQITSGGVELPAGGFTVAGANFSFVESRVPFDPATPIFNCTRGCLGNTTVPLGVRADDLVNHTAVYNGATYITGPGPLGNSLVSGGFSGVVTLPPVTPGTIALQAPLTFNATFIYSPSAGVTERVPLTGSGIATVVFTAVFPESGQPLWRFDGGQYRITPPACATQRVDDAVAVSVRSTSFDPAAVPNGPAGTFFIDATVTNTSSETLGGPVNLVVDKLTGGNRLLSATDGDGVVGSKQSVAATLSAGATEQVRLAVGLSTRNPFEFLVSVEACVP